MNNRKLNLRKDFVTLSHGPRYVGWRATPKEFQELPHDGYGYRIVDGVLHLRFGKSFQHYKIQKRIVSLIRNAVGNDSPGEVLEETNLFLPTGEIFHPDIIYFKDSIPSADKTCIHSIPDMIVEILSSHLESLEKRMIAYLKNGVKEYWLIEPIYKKISRFTNRNEISWEIESADRLASEYLERLELDAKDLFQFYTEAGNR
ncbi:Uma2 family endonuclease [Leptospira ilyithenensis]|uniref:Uma2 family endonuclease n=1 Tax=Leptospira ilyithenensis TaxID=2484901 RepID=A0A4R9LLM6_9LEPT|nr:Uma2 family endonuclease [Leptospira ilyithenensis]TGN06890.1 Uma2 family endonuclease [Leptospira ilyithenensis]